MVYGYVKVVEEIYPRIQYSLEQGQRAGELIFLKLLQLTESLGVLGNILMHGRDKRHQFSTDFDHNHSTLLSPTSLRYKIRDTVDELFGYTEVIGEDAEIYLTFIRIYSEFYDDSEPRQCTLDIMQKMGREFQSVPFRDEDVRFTNWLQIERESRSSTKMVDYPRE